MRLGLLNNHEYANETKDMVAEFVMECKRKGADALETVRLGQAMWRWLPIGDEDQTNTWVLSEVDDH